MPMLPLIDDVKNLPPEYTAPLDAAHFKLLAIGTSITWGAGLRSIDKYPYVLGQKLAARHAERFPKGLALAHYARCGAQVWQHDLAGLDKDHPLPADQCKTVNGSLADIPFSKDVVRNLPTGDCGADGAPFLWVQASRAFKDFTDAKTKPDLIVLDAGANDVDFMNAIVVQEILGGTHRSIEVMYERIIAIRESVRGLLARIDAELGGHDVPILLCGYFRAIGPAFVTGGIEGFAGFLEQVQNAAKLLGVRQEIDANMEVFERFFRNEWSALAENMRATGASKYANVYFVDPEFGDNHGFGSTEPWVFPNSSPPPDARSVYRTCNKDTGACFHPNELGAARYASACYQKLLTLGW